MDDEKLVKALYGAVQAARLYRSCVTCSKFEEATEVCTMFQQRPPARIIAQGCQEYEETPPF